jgi:hypothetical protein
MDTTTTHPEELTHPEPPAASLHAVFGVASAALYLLTFFIFMLERNPALWGSTLAVSLFATASAFGVKPRRCARAGGIGGGLMAVSAVGAYSGSSPWAWSMLGALGGSYLLVWAEYRCPQKALLAFHGHALVPAHPLHQLHPLQRLHRT